MPAPRPALERPRSVLLSGTSVALARHLGWPVGVTRLIFVVTTFLAGAGALLYLWIWALTPLEAVVPSTEDPWEVRRTVPVAAILLAISVIPVSWLLTAGNPGLIAIIIGLCVVAVGWTIRFDAHDPARSSTYCRVVQYSAAGLLIIASAVILIGGAGVTVASVVLAIVAFLVGIGILVSPFAIRRWQASMAKRAETVRSAHQSEVAAHLHDSVLQTLALIQNRAGSSSEIARIARAQERELRDWLYTGSAPIDNDLATELKEIASELELEYPVTIDVVTAGDSAELASGPLLAASREAMVNAARHAGGTVSVYVEASDRAVDVYVRDRGPGFDPATVPAGRLGVRESILGRMARAGGTASVGPGSGGEGTEVHLSMERNGAAA